MDVLDTQLRQTVRSRMIADVPLGSLLSGGIVSLLVVALMQRASARPVKTFPAAFEQPSDAFSTIPGLASIFDEPFGDAFQVPTLLMSSRARRVVTVAVRSGGGDELFGGYSRYIWHDQLRRTMERMPDSAGRGRARCSAARRSRLARRSCVCSVRSPRADSACGISARICIACE